MQFFSDHGIDVSPLFLATTWPHFNTIITTRPQSLVHLGPLFDNWWAVIPKINLDFYFVPKIIVLEFQSVKLNKI
jgi:hypothetical protein